MKFVTMYHPDVEGEASVPETAVGQHSLSGWKLVSDALAEMPKEKVAAIAEQKGVPVPPKASKETLVKAVVDASTTDTPDTAG